MERIEILVTGGTFDKEYDELTGRLFFRQTHVAEMLSLGRCRVPVSVRRLMMIDSLDMDGAHRRRILRACLRSKARRIVVTHGTDTGRQFRRDAVRKDRARGVFEALS